MCCCSDADAFVCASWWRRWLQFRVDALEIESQIAAGLPFQLPVLLSKSSLYADDD